MSALAIPAMSLVVLVGVSGSGKSTFAAQKFGPHETLSSDAFRALVSNDQNDQGATAAAFDALRYVAAKRLEAGLLTVIDATNVQPAARKSFVDLAKAHDVLPVAIVLDVPAGVAVDRNASRPDRDFGAQVVRRQHDQLRRSLRFLGKEGFRRIHVLDSIEAIADAEIVREPLLTDRRGEHGPFDAIGDVHGCRSELETLLQRLGYDLIRDAEGRPIDARHPEERRAIFLGDLVDRGPDVPGVLRLAMGMVRAGNALAVPGNHEEKLLRALDGKEPALTHGLEESLTQLAAETPEFREDVRAFCRELVSHLILDDGRLVVAHAGLKESYHGRASGRVRAFALYGDTTGESDEFGLPVRLPWADDYRGSAVVLYGHTPTPEVTWVNNTACLDTGCVFGGELSAMRYPEREVVSVPAERVWYEPVRPLRPPPPPERDAGVLRIDDVLGAHSVETATHGRIAVRAENAAGALEVMARWAIDPRWLLHLPPTMSPPATSSLPGYLEHPNEAFSAYRADGIDSVIAEEKHMGSRAIVLAARNPDRFGAPAGWRGVVHTRTGRRFFHPAVEAEVLEGVHSALEASGILTELETDWVLLDTEIVPWSVKAGDLIRDLYASVAAAATAALPAAVATLETAAGRGIDVGGLLDRTRRRAANADAYRDSYRRYAADERVQIAPFQVLASEGRTHASSDHSWHLGIADRLVAADPVLFRPTARRLVTLSDDTAIAEAVSWWEELTAAGGEGIVVKPHANFVRRPRGLVQPGIKVRGREYLRIIYGPDYTDEAHLARLRDRSLGHKRSMAAREYALGLESLDRVVRREPLWRVHQAVFAILAMESEPVDPRL
jgi:protein phosphatase